MADTNSNGWVKLIIGLLIGALAPSLIAWGSMSTNISNNKEEIDKKVDTKVFVEYKDGNTAVLGTMQKTLEKIEAKL